MGVKIREKIKGSGVYWVFAAQDGRRRSWTWKAGKREVAEEVAKRLMRLMKIIFHSIFRN